MNQEYPEDQEQPGDSQIRWLRSMHDTDALYQLMLRDKQLTQGLEAAGALVELGDARGLDHLIEVLRSPSTYLRREAASILRDLGHPRGLNAVELAQPAPDVAQPRPPRPAAPSPVARRDEEAYADFNAAKTDELMAIWHEHDRSQWSDQDFDLIREILTERLGQPPPGHGGPTPAQGRTAEDIDEDADPRIQGLWIEGNLEGLNRILETENWPLQLEAAEALADLGDLSGLDFLIGALDDRDEEARTTAAEILEWLDFPRGNLALQAHGIEFDQETGQAAVEEEHEPQPAYSPGGELRTASAEFAPPAYPQTTSSWEELQRSLGATPTVPPTWRTSDTPAPGPSLGLAFTGAVGGVLGLMLFYAGLYLLGLLPPLDTSSGGWLVRTLMYYLPASVVIGALLGLTGRSSAPASAIPATADVVEGDIRPSLTALLKGILSAVVVDAVLFFSLLGA